MTSNRQGINSFDPPPGMVRTGSIVGYDASTNTIQVQLTETQAARGKPVAVPVGANFPLLDSNGLFIGSLPAKNTPITVAQGTGGQYFVVGFKPENLALIPNLKLGEILLHTTSTSEISLDSDSHIRAGSDTNQLHIFAGSQQFPKGNLISLNFENENHFTQGFREIGGLVKRDLSPNPQASSYTGDTKLEDDNYDITSLSLIGLDPTATANDLTTGPTKNPAFVEHREIVYEFQYQSQVDSDNLESNKYLTSTSSTSQANIYSTPNRRSSRSDTMSLSLVAPNFLIEQVSGTSVDIFGNVLDINRLPLPVGLNATNTLRANGTVATTNAQQSYINIRTLERKSIAYHFEINARKDPSPTNQGPALSINNDNYNAKLQRSRFSFDVDKEGQFKLNVPASSETGNIPLLTRAENYSTFGTTDNNNPNQLWFNQSGQQVSQDIYVDSFAAPMSLASTTEAGFGSSFAHGSITLQDNSTGANAGPTDRISQFVDNLPYNIKHGTAFHDILQSNNMQRQQLLLSYPTGAVDSPDLSYIANDPATNAAAVQSTINVGGTGANAGGRSGLINFDGSIELNIGANTSDRQSMWLDTAGGIVANIGRDLNNRSLMLSANGAAFIQIGGPGVSGDARFANAGNDVALNGILDIRVFSGGFTHIFRFDEKGLVIMTPGRMAFHSGQGTTFSSDGNIEIDAESVIIQQRPVIKIFGGSI